MPEAQIIDPLLLDGATAPDRHHVLVGGGELLAYCAPTPDADTENQDAAAVIPYGPQAAVFVVADGAGGLPAGRLASQTAVRALIAELESASEKTIILRTSILDGIEAANAAVLGLGNGSATTFTVITIEGLTARAYQVGDSEAIIVGQRGIIRLQTLSHSPTGHAVEAGFLDQREALHHHDRHLVSNFLGSANMRIDMGAEIGLRPRDTVILASDGLLDNVHTAEIIERARKGPLLKAADAIIALARRRMNGTAVEQPSKPDDLSLILFRKPGRP
ncbi:MAG: protein phosphatase 2C domain-containing protein [Proteobacteria bacterium]|nr:protein phosphatase 2C domain-containing protein [Pseudomonadota bacterium]